MAPKRPVENSLPASQSEEYVSASEDDVEDHDDEQEAVDGEIIEESDDGEETEDDDEEKSTVNASAVTPESSDSDEQTNSGPPSPSPEPMDSEPIKSKQKSKPKISKTVDESTQEKKTVIGGGGNKDDVKKGSGGHRLWSEEDVILILEGMIHYKATTGIDPDAAALHEVIKKSLHINATRNQLTKKLWNLKKKYQNYLKKGEEPVFSNPYEVKSFELSKKIWGVEGSNHNTSSEIETEKGKQVSKKGDSAGDDSECEIGDVGPKTLGSKRGYTQMLGGDELLNELGYKKDALNGGIRKKEKVEVSGDEEFSSLSLERDWFDWGHGIGKGILFDVSMIGSVKAMELNEKWKQLHIDELELFVQRTELINENAAAVLEAIKKPSLP